MVRIPRLNFTGRRLLKMLPTIGGVGAALSAAAFCLILPDWRLEAAVAASGLPQLFAAAQPPLGLTARALIVLGTATLAGAVSWSILYLLWGPGGFLAPKTRAAGAPPVGRRADAHPDAPTRMPLSADELGVPPPPPVMEAAPPPSVRPLPADLDQPLAAFHPAAIPAVPLEPVRAIRPIAIDPIIERIETFSLPVPETPTTLDGLIERLERSVGRRGQVVQR